MNQPTTSGYCADLISATRSNWNRFWFTPTDPATLGCLRVLAGSMLFYTHLAWSAGLLTMFGPHGKLGHAFNRAFHGNSMTSWSHLTGIESPEALWSSHILALIILALFTVGLWTRVTSVLAFLITVSYAHRAGGALFGLDQLNGMLALYLMVGPSGAAYSMDAWRKGNFSGQGIELVGVTISTRLIQLHMCLIYLFAGFGKLLGVTWWDGTALWGAFANFEYQTIDMTWLAHYEEVVNVLTHVTIFWEVTYAALVWNRYTRPIMIFLAIPLHLGIALCMGMMTFGLVMLYGNLAFVSPKLVRRTMAVLSRPAWNSQPQVAALATRT